MISLSKDLILYKACLEKISEHEAGGKGWNLFRLRHFGFPVPPWFVVSSCVFNEVIGTQKDRIENTLSNIDFTNQGALDDASLRIRTFISHAEFTEQFSQELLESLDEMFGKEALFSVRSSVIGEDSTENSFAGQMDSFLNVCSEEVIEAIKKVWASAFSSRALLYRRMKDISLIDISTAVIIQEMVQAAASGVLFTREPESRAKQCVISAGFGLGEGVVANLVETDTYKINWDSKKIWKEVGVKDCRVVLDTKGQGGNHTESVPPDLQLKQVLTNTQIEQLRAVGVKAEKCFGAPQDIEWALDERGRLFILQTRPIIFTNGTLIPSAVHIWDNSNIVESYPGLTLPLTFTFICKGYENSFRNAALGFLFFKSLLNKDLHIFKNMIGLLDGHVYYNLLNWYHMLSYLPGFKKHKESWDQMIGISQKIDFPQSKLSPFNNFCSLAIVIWRLLVVRQTAKRFFIHFNSVYSNFKEIDVSAATEDELIAIYESLARELTDRWHLTLYNDFCAMKYYDWLKKLCSHWGLAKYPNLDNDLLCGEAGVESVAPVRSLVHLVDLLRAQPIYQTLISEKDNHVIWHKIQRETTYPELKEALEVHLQTFGDRVLEELKLERPSLRDEPASLIRLIKSYYQLGLSVETMEKQEQEIRKNAEEIVLQHLKNPFKRLIFRFVLRNARLSIANRENMRFARSRLFGIVRRLFRRMADLFVEKGLLESSSDIYYLTVDEVFGFVQGTAVTQNLKALVQIRKAEYAEFAQRTPKERIQTTGIPYLNLSSFYGSETGDGTSKTLKGVGCSSGIAEGTAKVVFDPNSTIGNGDSILVAKSTDPGWVFLMISSKGIVVEKGSVLSHTAIIGRELGIPTIVGVKDATKLIPDGANVSINGSTGEIRWQ